VLKLKRVLSCNLAIVIQLRESSCVKIAKHVHHITHDYILQKVLRGCSCKF